jgi:DNA-binding response OmpR family regulator
VHLLIVEDDEAIAGPLSEALAREGFEVTHRARGREAMGVQGIDLVLLDLSLPDLDGNEVCRRIRADSAVPIIVVTSRSDELDRVLLFELGADDYVVKPFFVRELIARIRAVGRRAGAGPAVGAGPQQLGALTIDRGARRVLIDDVEVELTPKEFDLLAFLAEAPGTVRTRSEVVESVWDPHWWGPTKTLDVHMASLRKKLGEPGWVETIRGVGYRFAELR